MYLPDCLSQEIEPQSFEAKSAYNKSALNMKSKEIYMLDL